MHLFLSTLGFGIVTAAVLSFGAVATTLQFGVTNYINFATGTYLSIGAFITWEFNVAMHVNFWLAVAFSAVVMAGFAVLVDWLVLARFAAKNPPVVLLVVTFGTWFVLLNGSAAVWGNGARSYRVSGNDVGHHLGPFLFTSDEYVMIGLGVIAMFAIHLGLTRTTLGRALRAMSDDAELAKISGMNTKQLTRITWAVSGALLGIGGSLLGLEFVSFTTAVGDTILFVIFSAVVVGGIGQPYGAMLGALLMGVATETAVVWISPAYKYDVAFIFLIAALMFRPSGLLSARGRTA
jgi:branched-subunit amino acid ABC-type transport system permease component